MLNQKLKNITTFIFDVDGVLTDGTVTCFASGEQVRTFLVKDGYAIEKAIQAGFNVCIITGGFQEGVKKRLEFLGIKNIYTNVKNKVEVFEAYIKENSLQSDEILYMGDDIPDYEVMNLCGIGACPADAADDIIKISDFVSTKCGGKGAVREIIEKTLKLQNKWPLLNNNANG